MGDRRGPVLPLDLLGRPLLPTAPASHPRIGPLAAERSAHQHDPLVVESSPHPPVIRSGLARPVATFRDSSRILYCTPADPSYPTASIPRQKSDDNSPPSFYFGPHVVFMYIAGMNKCKTASRFLYRYSELQ